MPTRQKYILWITLIIVTGIVTYYYLNHSRFKITSSAGNIVYEVDIKTDKTWAIAKGEEDTFFDPITGMEFVRVPGGSFEMGDLFLNGDNDEKYIRTVHLDKFWLGKYEVTQGQWMKCMGSNPSHFKNGDNYPVEEVSWNDVQGFIEKLNNRNNTNTFRLPSEAEWEYAARSCGKKMEYAGTSDVNELYRYANFCDKNCNKKGKTKSQNDGYKNTAPVGSYKPNELGIYDMSGNVFEWCEDIYTKDYSKVGTDNPIYRGAGDYDYRVLRGGAWDFRPSYARCANRGGSQLSGRDVAFGFRLARTYK